MRETTGSDAANDSSSVFPTMNVWMFSPCTPDTPLLKWNGRGRTGVELLDSMRKITVVVVTVACAGGCLARSRLNASCEWAPEPKAHLNLQRFGDRGHLVEDVDIAEENGVRYGDSFRNRDGQKEEARQRDQCTAALLAEVARTHGVGLRDVEDARGGRLWYVDLPVALSFGTLFCLASSTFVSGLFTRISVEDRAAAVLALLVAAVLASISGLIALNAFGTLIEVMRHGDLHGSYRASRGLPWSEHWLAVFGVETWVFLHIGGRRLRRGWRRRLTPPAFQ